MQKFRISYRRLPHWRASDATYFVTWRLHDSQAPLSPQERALVVGALRYFHNKRYSLMPYTVLDDHGHCVVRPRAPWRLGQITQSWFSWTSHELVKRFGRCSPVWQGEPYDRIIRNDQELDNVSAYILTNATKRWPGIVDYPYMGLDGDTESMTREEFRRLMASLSVRDSPF